MQEYVSQPSAAGCRALGPVICGLWPGTAAWGGGRQGSVHWWETPRVGAAPAEATRPPRYGPAKGVLGTRARAKVRGSSRREERDSRVPRRTAT